MKVPHRGEHAHPQVPASHRPLPSATITASATAEECLRRRPGPAGAGPGDRSAAANHAPSTHHHHDVRRHRAGPGGRVLRPGFSSATLQRHAERSVAGCLVHAGFDPAVSLTTELAWSPRDRALQRCWSRAAKDPRFERLALVDPIADREEAPGGRVRGLAVRRAVGRRAGHDQDPAQRAGWLSAAAGGRQLPGRIERARPRALLSRRGQVHRRIDRGLPMVGRDVSPDPDGKSCLSHAHEGSGEHAHGCYGTDTYPDSSTGSERS